MSISILVEALRDGCSSIITMEKLNLISTSTSTTLLGLVSSLHWIELPSLNPDIIDV
jgi:hypothetical protein